MDLSTVATSDLVAQFLDAKIAARRSPKTIATYRDRLTRFATWLGARPITRATLRAYLADLQTQPSLSPASAWSYFHDVGVFCSWLVEEEIIDKNPARRLAPTKPKRLPASYSADHLIRLLAVCDERDRAVLIVLLDTGLRAGELVSLNRRSIDWESGRFTVIGKGDKERAGELSAYARAALRCALELREDTDPALFTGPKGRLTPSGLRQMISRRAREAGIRDDVRRLVHGFRATFAKAYILQGGDLESLRRLLGHTSIAMAAHYAQLADDELLATKRRINPLGRFFPDAG